MTLYKQNTFYQRLKINHSQTKHHICLGLDPDPSYFPKHLDGSIKNIKRFLIEVIQSTHDICNAYKPNISFFESLGLEGLKILVDIRKVIPKNIPVIIDAKKGDIGNTSKMQAKYIFDHLGADAITLHPYMGLDSLEPFFNYKDKFIFVLGLTSNPGANDFEKQITQNGDPLYIKVIKKCQEWNETYNNIGYVIGGTQHELKLIRQLTPDSLFLIPGVGKQGGDYHDVIDNGGLNKEGLALINMSRSLLYCSQERDYTKHIREMILSFKK